MIQWQQKTFDELSLHELYAILQQRVNVFVVEQQCPYPEIDGADHQAIHLWATQGLELVAYARIFLGTSTSGFSRIGRVLSAHSARGTGLGRELIQRAIALCQMYLHDFYASFGFTDISDEYLEDGIPHIDMERQP